MLALLAVLALGASAATLNTARHGLSQGTNEDGVGGDGSSFDLGSPPLNSSAQGTSLSTDLLQVLFGVLLLLGCIGLVVTIYRNGWRSVLPALAVTVLGLALLLVLFYGLQSLNTSSEQKGVIGDELSFPSGASAGDVVAPVMNHSTILFALLAVAVIVASVLLVRSTGDSPLLDPSSDASNASDESRTPEAAGIGAAAGRAADTLETDASRSNAIYHAWQEMTTHLDLQRETSTPGEFAAAAVAAGMARDDVNELTELFEATRYGNIDASEERERRALAVLRRIEREYTEEQ